MQWTGKLLHQGDRQAGSQRGLFLAAQDVADRVKNAGGDFVVTPENAQEPPRY